LVHLRTTVMTMQQVFVENLGGKTFCLQFSEDSSILLSTLKEVLHDRFGLPTTLLRYTQNGRELENNHCTIENTIIPIRLSLRIVGGKGGFGSLLRGAPAKPGVKKTTNFEACRDLSGRRLRHVNNEKKLERWFLEEKERALEKVAESYIKKISKNKHTFDDDSFNAQTKEGVEVIQGAVEVGLEEAIQLKKRKREVKEESPTDSIIPVKRRKTSETSSDLSNSITSMTTTTTTTTTTSQEALQPIPAHNESEILVGEQEIKVIEVNRVEDKAQNIEFDINKYESAEQLQQVGMDILKQELQRRGMKCGGSHKERAERLFKVKGVADLSCLDPKLFVVSKK